MAQLGTLAALLEDMGLIPSTCMAVHNSSSRGSNVAFWLS